MKDAPQLVHRLALRGKRSACNSEMFQISKRGDPPRPAPLSEADY